MSSDTRREYQVPIMFDVTSDSIEGASEAAMALLGKADLVGEYHTTNGLGTARIESIWTIERVAKAADGNDNDHGVVVFQDDLDYLHALLKRMWDSSTFITAAEQGRHQRLMAYFDPDTGRCGSDDLADEDA